MAQLESLTQELQPPSRSELAVQAEDCLADLEGARGWCTGCAINLHLPCTGTKTGTCQLSRHLASWNEFLWPARLELRYLSDDSGKLSLVTFDEALLPSPKKYEVRQAVGIARHLLKTHSCVVALNVRAASFKGSEALFGDALGTSPFIKSLKIRFCTLSRQKGIFSVIPSLVNLQELELGMASEGPAAFCRALTAVLQTNTSLKALRVPKLHMNGRAADEFLQALIAQQFLTDLCLHGSVIGEACPKYRSMFSKYIAATTSLTKLSVRGYNEVRQNCLKSVLEGLIENQTVTDASLTGLIMDSECSTLMTDVLNRNNVLRRFNISLLTFDAWVARLKGGAISNTADCSSWLLALPKNDTLQAVTLPLLICDPDMWGLIFKELSANKSAMKLTIGGHCSERHLWERVCDVLLASGVEANVVFETTLDALHKKEMLTCTAFSEFYAFPCQDSLDGFYRTFLMLPSLNHISSAHLEIWLPDVEEKLIAAIASYIKTSCSLRKLHLTVWLRYIFRVSTKMCWALMCESLHQNTSIKQLRVGVRCMDEEDVQLLAKTVISSRNIRRFQLTVGKSDIAAAFVGHLRSGIEKNYTLVNVIVDGGELGAMRLAPDLFALRSTARRNAELVVSALRFVDGTMEDRHCAQALERVAQQTGLLEELAEMMSISVEEAAALVHRKLRLIQGMDDFMRLAGVVRERVRCYAIHGDRVQLDSLNEDCWLLVRCHLMLEDIKE